MAELTATHHGTPVACMPGGQLAVSDPRRAPDARAAHDLHGAWSVGRRAPSRAERGGLGRRDIERCADRWALGGTRRAHGEGGAEADEEGVGVPTLAVVPPNCYWYPPLAPVRRVQLERARSKKGSAHEEECPGAVLVVHNNHLAVVFCFLPRFVCTFLTTCDDHLCSDMSIAEISHLSTSIPPPPSMPSSPRLSSGSAEEEHRRALRTEF